MCGSTARRAGPGQGADACGRARHAWLCRGEHRLPQRRRYADRAQVADAKAAVRWLRANASRFNIDPDEGRVFGHDPGATIAAILGTAGDVAALEGDSARRASRAGCRPSSRSPDPSTGRDRESLAHVSKDDAPTLILHGTADTVVPTLESQALVSALKVAGVNATLELQIGVSHDLGGCCRRWRCSRSTASSTSSCGRARRAAARRAICRRRSPNTSIRSPSTSAARLQDLFDPGARSRHVRELSDLPAAGLRDQPTRRYPVIYFMHGSLVDSKRPIVAGYVARVDAAIRSGVMPPTIVVMPQGLNQNRWMDSRDGTKPMESVSSRT